VQVMSNGRFAITTGWYGEPLRLTDLETGGEVASFEAEPEISACSVSSRGVVILGGESGRVYLLNPENIVPPWASRRLHFLGGR